MVTSALVLTLDPLRRSLALEALGGERGVTVGEAFGDCLPVVLETESAEEGEHLVERLGELPGVAFVSVVRIDFDDQQEEPDGPA